MPSIEITPVLATLSQALSTGEALFKLLATPQGDKIIDHVIAQDKENKIVWGKISSGLSSFFSPIWAELKGLTVEGTTRNIVSEDANNEMEPSVLATGKVPTFTPEGDLVFGPRKDHS